MAVLMLGGCVSSGRKAAMRVGLDSINAVNRNGQPFAVADVKPYVEFFDDHGTPNDRLLAHYLLGLAYYDHGEAPMALQCYQEALDCADTTATDCDYAQLSRVYAQMANVFYYQALYRKQLEYIDNSVKYAWRGKDTLAALMSYELKCHSYRMQKMPDSLIYICENSYKQYIQHGYSSNAAIVLSYAISTLIKNKEFQKAKQYMDIYELKSGFFDTLGNIEHGHEIYYNVKGCYYKDLGILDSANYYFRKELRDGKDFNNQHAAAKGLSVIYQRLNIPDSAAKYYQYAYAMNDSMYAHQTTETVERMQSMYDYSRHQKEAQQEKERSSREEAKKLIALGVLLLVVIIASAVIYLLYRDRKEKRRQYLQNLEKLERTQFEVMQLREHASDFEGLIADKEKEIEALRSDIENRRQRNRQGHVATMEQIHDSDIYQELVERERKQKALTQEHIRRCRMLVIEKMPDFTGLLLEQQYKLKENDFNVCMLLRLGVKSKEISMLLKISQARVSQICTKVLGTVFGESEGGAKELSERLCEYF